MRKPFALLAAAALVCGVQAQDARPLAIQNARILTMQNGVIDNGTLLVRNGAIEAVGTDVEIPAGYQVVDAGGGTVMPGLVSAWSHAGLNRATPPRLPAVAVDEAVAAGAAETSLSEGVGPPTRQPPLSCSASTPVRTCSASSSRPA